MRLGFISDFIDQLRADPLNAIIGFVFLSVCILTGLILHECAHGYVALKCGDPTAKMRGRLTLNPAKHLDPVGTVCMVLLGIGWAKPVPVNPRNFRHYRRDYILVSLAGIVTNFLLFLVSIIFFVLIWKHAPNTVAWGYAGSFFYRMASINICLAIFNLIPVPPLDGYRVMNQFVFKGRLDMNPQTMMIIRYVFLAICISGVFSNLLGSAVSSVLGFFMNIFYGIL